MDNLNNTTDNANPQTSIVSSLASATPITSEIVSDTFESDPKFEITTLEKASYEDLYLESNSTEQTDLAQPVESASNDDDNSQRDGDKQLQNSNGGELIAPANEKQSNTAEQETVAQPIEEAVNKVVNNPEVPVVADPIESHSMTETSGTIEAKPQTGDSQETTPDNSNSNEDQGSKTKESESGDAGKQQQSIDSEHTEQLEQPSAIIASSDDITHPADSGEQATNNDLLSHTSVDEQMEKVIDNIVELGGPYHFSQTLGQDKEKVLESIRREISCDRSSIDLIAEVASKQQSIEIGPLDQYKQQQLQQSVFDANIKSTLEEITSGDVLAICPQSPKVESSEKPPEEEAQPAPEPEKIPMESNPAISVTDNNQTEKADVESIPVDDAPQETAAVEAPPVPAEPIAKPSRSRRTRTPKKSLEILPTATEFPKEPLEEVTQAEEKTVKPLPTTSAPDAELVEKMEVETEDVKDTQPDTQPDPPVVEAQPEPSEPIGRQSRSLRTRTPKKPIEIETPVVEQPKKQARKSRGPSEDSSKSHGVTKSAPSIKLPYKSRQTISVSDPAARVPKRAHEEETPEVDEEPPKKQSRRSRGATIDHNNSYEATKNSSGLKLTLKSRQTISVSDPATRPESIREVSAAATTSKRADIVQADKKYTCHDCGFATDRLNNLVYHTKAFCKGKCDLGEVMKADITRQQQQAKNKKKR